MKELTQSMLMEVVGGVGEDKLRILESVISAFDRVIAEKLSEIKIPQLQQMWHQFKIAKLLIDINLIIDRNIDKWLSDSAQA